VARDEVLEGEQSIFGGSARAGESGIVQRLERVLPAKAPRANIWNGQGGWLLRGCWTEPLPAKEGGSRPGRVWRGSWRGGRAAE
jgi:hypothetical protein